MRAKVGGYSRIMDDWTLAGHPVFLYFWLRIVVRMLLMENLEDKRPGLERKEEVEELVEYRDDQIFENGR